MPDTHPLVTIQIVVHNGRRYVRHCLDAVCAQTYPSIEVVVLDNSSADGTADIVATHYPKFHLIRHHENIGMWPGQELVLKQTRGAFVLALSVDVLLDPRFVERAVAAFIADPSIAAVQSKTFQYRIEDVEREGLEALHRDVIDTCGFGMTHARKVLNIGHGCHDDGSFDTPKAIFGVEGAAPFFRRSVLDECRVDGLLVDPDYFWYGDDLDLAWRITLFGHRQVFVPDVIAWHDRSTTKGEAHSAMDHLKRVSIRRAIPLKKRRLDWSNVRFTIIKNDYIMNLLRDAPWILLREASTLAYALAFEPRVLTESWRFLRLLPRMLRRRRHIMQRAVASPSTMYHWLT